MLTLTGSVLFQLLYSIASNSKCLSGTERFFFQCHLNISYEKTSGVYTKESVFKMRLFSSAETSFFLHVVSA